MRILLDECVPRRLKRDFGPHAANTVTEMGWSGIKNGALLDLAESQFDAFLTVDRNLPYQQNLSKRAIPVIVLVAKDNNRETLQPLIAAVLGALETAQAGEVVLIGARS